MEFAPSTYYAAKSLKRQDKDLTHDDLKLKVKQVFKERFTLLRENFTLSYLVTFSSRTNQVSRFNERARTQRNFNSEEKEGSDYGLKSK